MARFLTVSLLGLLMATLLLSTPAYADNGPTPSKAPASDGKMNKMVKDPELSKGLEKVVAKMRNADPCRQALDTCLSACSAVDGGCSMDCQTDCSVCVLESSGKVDNSRCGF